MNNIDQNELFLSPEPDYDAYLEDKFDIDQLLDIHMPIKVPIEDQSFMISSHDVKTWKATMQPFSVSDNVILITEPSDIDAFIATARAIFNSNDIELGAYHSPYATIHTNVDPSTTMIEVTDNTFCSYTSETTQVSDGILECLISDHFMPTSSVSPDLSASEDEILFDTYDYDYFTKEAQLNQLVYQNPYVVIPSLPHIHRDLYGQVYLR